MDLERLKYTELRNLAKSLGLKAKGKAPKLIRDISKHYEDNETSGSSDKKPNVSVSSSADSEDNEIVFSCPEPLVADAEEVADVVEVAEQSVDDEIVFILNSSEQQKEEQTAEHNKSGELENIEDKLEELEEVQNKSIEFEDDHATKSDDVLDEEIKDQLNTTFEIETVEDDQGSDAGEDNDDQDCVEVKENTHQDVVQDNDDQDVVEVKVNDDQADVVEINDVEMESKDDQVEGEEEKENMTIGEKGDGVENLLDVMRPEMTDEEMKAELMAAIDKKVQKRKVTIMSPNAGATEFVSRIPTFSTTNKSQTNEEKAALKGKDWQKIHEKLFSKQDGLDVYLEKKNKRMKKLNTPLKSAKRIAEETQKTAEKLRKRKGLRSPAKISSTQKPKAQHQSFIPKITSTKSISLQFTSTATTISSSVTRSTRTPVKSKLVKMAKKSPVKSSTASAKKPTPKKQTPKRSPQKTTPAKLPLAKRPFSPYNFGNKSLANRSATGTPEKPKFDLKASLAKPITWKQHTGKLRPVAFGDAEPQYFKLGKNTSIQTNRENRRADTAKSRTSRRENLLNNRRNIK